MFWLLDAVYVLAVIAFSPWLLFAAIRHGKYREGYAEKFWGRVPQRLGNRPCAWFHAVSVGEVNLLPTLLDRFNAENPGWDCVISTTTKTGYELARKKFSGHSVFYCPLDFSWAVSTALRRIRPDLLVLTELELWPNLIRMAKLRQCRIAIVNGRLSARSFRGYRRFRWLFAPILRQVELIAVQGSEYAARFRDLLGKDCSTQIEITGSIKFDGILTDRRNRATCELRRLAGIQEDDVVFLAGSTQEPEEELAVAAFQHCRRRYPRLRLLIAPRHVTRCNEIALMMDRAGISWQRRTSLDAHGADPESRILLIDTIGELAAWWGTSQIAFVGGSIGSRGGQNMIEPAGFGAAVSFGPNTSNFRDIVRMLLNCDGAVVIRTGEELTRFVEDCLDNQDRAQILGMHAQQLVMSQQGAADRTIRLLQGITKRVSCPASVKAA